MKERDVWPLTFNFFCESPLHTFVENAFGTRGCMEGGPPDDDDCPSTLEVGACCSQQISGYKGKCVDGLSDAECVGGEYSVEPCWNCYEPEDPPADLLHGGGRCCWTHKIMEWVDGHYGEYEHIHCTDSHFTDTASKCRDKIATECWPFGRDEEWQSWNPFNPVIHEWGCAETYTEDYRCIRDAFYYDDDGTPTGTANALAECATEQGWCCNDFGSAIWTDQVICERSREIPPYDGQEGTWVGGIVKPDCAYLEPCCAPNKFGKIYKSMQTQRECNRLGGFISESCWIGACDLGCGRCVTNTVEGECMSYGGRFLGVGQGCEGAPVSTGACCLPDGQCRSPLTLLECTRAGGLFYGKKWGEPLTCLDVECSLTAGACCRQSGSCSGNVTLEECAQLSGATIFMGIGTFCDGPDAVYCGLWRACCLENGDCVDELTEAECTELGGTLQPSGVTCETAGCEPLSPYGPCCIFGTCYSATTPEECAAYSGTFMGFGGDCSEVTCP